MVPATDFGLFFTSFKFMFIEHPFSTFISDEPCAPVGKVSSVDFASFRDNHFRATCGMIDALSQVKFVFTHEFPFCKSLNIANADNRWSDLP